jgi:hypothetical protein
MDTNQNLQQWFDDAKRDLIESGLCIDQVVRNGDGTLVSKLNFRPEEIKRRILNMDETIIISRSQENGVECAQL